MEVVIRTMELSSKENAAVFLVHSVLGWATEWLDMDDFVAINVVTLGNLESTHNRLIETLVFDLKP